jgi:glycosyltransferase involved in cell wall biosynthesis
MTASAAPPFSIITPTLDQLTWLKLCAASVGDQDGTRWEHIIQDGGSGADFEAWVRTRPHIRAFQEPDMGMYDALNRGFRRAAGHLLGWLNSDEQYLPGTLRRVEQFFAENPNVEVLFGDAILVDQTGRALSYRRVVTPSRTHTKLEHLGTLSCATFFRRTIIEQGLLFDTRWRSIGDCVWIKSLLDKGIRMASLPEALAVYTFTGVNVSGSARGFGEMREWSRQPDAPPRWLRVPAVLWHRVRKLAAGAYRKRHLRYAIYTASSPERRVTFQVRGVGFGWPGATAPAAPQAARAATKTPAA